MTTHTNSQGHTYDTETGFHVPECECEHCDNWREVCQRSEPAEPYGVEAYQHCPHFSTMAQRRFCRICKAAHNGGSYIAGPQYADLSVSEREELR